MLYLSSIKSAVHSPQAEKYNCYTFTLGRSLILLNTCPTIKIYTYGNPDERERCMLWKPTTSTAKSIFVEDLLGVNMVFTVKSIV